MTPQELFELLARMTWRTIECAATNRVQFGEDAITSVNLNALASSVGRGVVVVDTRVDEATKGCDFEFWIGNESTGWARYAIQAKKINIPTGSYTKLGHQVGGELQLDVLDRYAKANRAGALYCFYNHSRLPHAWHCALPPDAEQLGCSVTPSAVVHTAMGQRGGRSFQALHANSATVPWRCLVSCLSSRKRPVKPTPRAQQLPAPAPHGWQNLDTNVHERLPASIEELLKSRNASKLVDAPDAFSVESALRPRWVGVVEVSRPDDERG